MGKLELEALRFYEQTLISRFALENLHLQDFQVQSFEMEQLDAMALRLKATFLGKGIGTIRYPANWKESLKERFCPRLILKRFPVVYEEYSLYNVCPHIDIKFKNNKQVHLEFLNSREVKGNG